VNAAGPDRFRPVTGSDADAWVDTSAGLVHVHRAGAGPPLVLLHSNGHSWREFENVIDALAERHHVIAWDMPGQGESDPVHPRTSIEGYADVLIDVLDGLGIDDAAFAGCSVGAFIAAALAAAHPERATHVALVEFAFREPAWWAAAWPGIQGLFGVPTMTREEIAARLHRPVDDALVARWNVDRNGAGARALIGVMWAIREHRIAEALAALRMPALVVYGGAGPTLECRPAVERVLPPSARVEVVEGAGHFPAIDTPGELVELLRRFVAEGPRT
jgi:3-oxoadipate enol-lactonase